jgi:CRP-like cAMP-binding protein
MSAAKPLDKRILLTNHFLLGQLDPAAIDRLLDFTIERQYRDSQVIFQKGDPGTGMMAVLRGRVKISVYSDEGKEVILNIIEPGQIFGEIALLDGKPRTADATAMGSCALLTLERRDFIPFLEGNPKVTIRLLELLCQRVRQTSELVESVALFDLPARMARLLLRMAETYGAPARQQVRINFKLPQREMGNLIAATRESVNKQLRAWQEDGVIAVDQGYITILRPDELKAWAVLDD